jgi:hypothetical protein
MQLLRSHGHRLGDESLRRRLAQLLAATLCVVAGLAIWFLITGSFDPTAAKILASTAVTSLCAGAGLLGASLLERTDARHRLGLVTILLAAFELVLVLAAIWSLSGGEAFWRALGAVTALLPACVHACLMLGWLRRQDGHVVQRLSGASVAFAMSGAVIVAGAFTLATGSPGGWFWRLLGVLAVLATLATLLAPIVRRLDRGRARGFRSWPADESGSAAPPAPTRKPGRLWLSLGHDSAGR